MNKKPNIVWEYPATEKAGTVAVASINDIRIADIELTDFGHYYPTVNNLLYDFCRSLEEAKKESEIEITREYEKMLKITA